MIIGGFDVKKCDEGSAFPPNKKPYKEPNLRVYGNIRTVTQASNVTGVPDSNNKGFVHKTA